jgi:hypothetical protein
MKPLRQRVLLHRIRERRPQQRARESGFPIRGDELELDDVAGADRGDHALNKVYALRKQTSIREMAVHDFRSDVIDIRFPPHASDGDLVDPRLCRGTQRLGFSLNT